MLMQRRELSAQALHGFPRTAKLWKAKNVPKYKAATAVSINTALAQYASELRGSICAAKQHQ